MGSLDKFKLVMAEIGEIIKATSVMQFEESYWAIELTERDLIWIYFHEQDNSFTLSADAGVIPEEAYVELLKFFLTFNALGQEQKTLKTALSGCGEKCLLLADHSALSLTALDFSGIFMAFAEQFIHWSYLLKSWPGASGEDKQKLMENISYMNPNLIRV
ncbi:type III secretion system chaperone [Thalassomonas haliotis]|uniref:Type III secretion system chaperone n=1 Tax=Thalassomonas haliotis TaxID=485448 RepID=A0ABY7V6S8_9GAMM|nr:type III secretion system chaperone [Thalassomonas haliotis]WDE09408.1 type III secretion system chaperone [Thalassomonas haliotis]